MINPWEKKQEHISPELTDFIQQQKIFFVGTAAEEGRVNISPKETNTFRVFW
jgi:predicted pyridoxine 5'-phosphate oxidase superfamily flavin-nucleotide-binding protein